MSNWEKVQLNKVADIKLSNVDKKTKANEKLVKLCNYTDVYKNSFIHSGLHKNFMIASCTNNEFNKFKLKEGQVAITKDSEKPNDIGIPAYISQNFEDVVLGYHLALFTPNNKLDGKYLNYWLNTKQSKRYFENNAGGSGQRCSLNLNVLQEIPLLLPNIENQKKIAKVLSDLDAKIELNNKINAELEAMAKLIYDYWFVQFDFPDKNGKPYKSSGGKMVYNEELKREIPAGWEVKEIGKLLAKESKVKKVPSSEYLSDGNIPIIDQSMKFICGFTNDTNTKIKTEIPIIVFGDHTRIVKLINFDFARGADGTQILLSNDERVPQHFFFQSITSIDLSNYGYARHFKFLKEKLTIVPEKDIVQKYELIAKNMFLKIKMNIEENQTLTELRDWLLPMLMNGQVSMD
jgi:type I restriction enzyme S subunit